MERALINFRRRVERLTLKLEMITAYGGHCVHCQETHPLFLTLDHIYNNGYLEKGKGIFIYEELAKNGFPQGDFQLLCHNCNAIKEYSDRSQSRSSIPVDKSSKGHIFFSPEQREEFMNRAHQILTDLNQYLIQNQNNPLTVQLSKRTKILPLNN